MRLFAALDPPPAAIADLEAALAGAAARTLRWMPSEQWHVTLAFYGDVPEADIDDLTERLATAATRTGPITLSLGGAGTFPRRPNSATVLWVGVGGDTDALGQLANRCRAAGRQVGVAVDSRKFAPHLTVARASAPANMSRPLTALWPYAGPTWTAESIRLVRSTLGAKVRHETVAEYALDRSRSTR